MVCKFLNRLKIVYYIYDIIKSKIILGGQIYHDNERMGRHI